MKATWNDTVIAESDDTVVVEGNHYFPKDSVRWDYLTPTTLTPRALGRDKPPTSRSRSMVNPTRTRCGPTWIPSRRRPDQDHVAFWKGVVVSRQTCSDRSIIWAWRPAFLWGPRVWVMTGMVWVSMVMVYRPWCEVVMTSRTEEGEV